MVVELLLLLLEAHVLEAVGEVGEARHDGGSLSNGLFGFRVVEM